MTPRWHVARVILLFGAVAIGGLRAWAADNSTDQGTRGSRVACGRQHLHPAFPKCNHGDGDCRHSQPGWSHCEDLHAVAAFLARNSSLIGAASSSPIDT